MTTEEAPASMENGTAPQNTSSGSQQNSREASSLSSPVPWYGSLCLGLYFSILAAITFYVLVATWPIPDPKDPSGFTGFSVFGLTTGSIPADLRLFLVVIAAGALGSLIHTITSFADYVGNRSLSINWIWWLLLRTPIGIALALLFYLALRGGLVIPSLPSASAGMDTTHLLNPYGIAAISALAGMFSKQATDKLREIFDTLFRTQDPVDRADPLTRVRPVISATEPANLAIAGSPILSVFGRNFRRDCAASIGGNSREVQWISQTRIALTLAAQDLAAATELQLIIHNPGPDGGDSEPFRIRVAGA